MRRQTSPEFGCCKISRCPVSEPTARPDQSNLIGVQSRVILRQRGSSVDHTLRVCTSLQFSALSSGMSELLGRQHQARKVMSSMSLTASHSVFSTVTQLNVASLREASCVSSIHHKTFKDIEAHSARNDMPCRLDQQYLSWPQEIITLICI